MNALARLHSLSAMLDEKLPEAASAKKRKGRRWESHYAKIMVPHEAVGYPGVLRIKWPETMRADGPPVKGVGRVQDIALDYQWETDAEGRQFIVRKKGKGEKVERQNGESVSSGLRHIRKDNWARVPAVFIYRHSDSGSEMSVLGRLRELNVTIEAKFLEKSR